MSYKKGNPSENDEKSSINWELSKENVQPLRQGRKMTSLNAILCSSKQQLNAQYSQDLRAFEESLIAFVGEDPLEIWDLYIKRIEEINVQGGGGLLVNVLQKCIQKFADDPRYNNDERFWDIWNKHVRCCGNALEVYKYLHCKMMFSKLSAFYINWALELESSGNMKEAHSVYEQGIRAGAEPFDTLQNHQKDFYVRFGHNMISKMNGETESLDPYEEDSRKVLGVLKTRGEGNSVGVVRNETVNFNNGDRQGLLTHSNKPSKPTFTIFDAENGDPRPLENVALNCNPKPIVSAGRNKENEQKAGKWTKNKLPIERRVPVNFAAPTFEIHQDAATETQRREIAEHNVLSAKKVHCENLLDVVHVKAVEDPNVRVMYCKEKIYAGLVEISFEELRAARYRAKQKRIQMREEELSLQRKIYEDIVKESCVKFFEEVKEYVKSIVPSGHATSDVSDVDSDKNLVSSAWEQVEEKIMKSTTFLECDTRKLLKDTVLESPNEAESVPTYLCPTKPGTEAFGIYEDPGSGKVEQREYLNTISEHQKTEEEMAKNLDDMFQDENDENVAPSGYVQTREAGPIAGILVPSTRVKFIPLEDETSDSEPECVPNTNVASKIPVTYEETINLPTSTRGFALDACVKSTPVATRKIVLDNGVASNLLETSRLMQSLLMRKHELDIVKIHKVNPFTDEFHEHYLQNLEIPINSNSEYTEVNGKMPTFRKNNDVTLADDRYTVKNTNIGKGSFGKVHQGKLKYSDDDAEVAFKVQEPPCVWEYYISKEIEMRLTSKSDPAKESFAKILNAYIYTHGSVLVSRFCPYGTLLNVANSYRMNVQVPESLVMYYAIELLYMIEKLHNCGIIHADIKPDNILVRGLPKINWMARSCEEMFAPMESNPTLVLTDFGQSIDMASVPSGTKFSFDVGADDLLCPEMKDGKPWTYQIDYFAIAGCVHCMLFKSYIKIQPIGNEWKICHKLHRNVSRIWDHFFNTLLNIPHCNNRPNAGNLRHLIQEDFFNLRKQKNFGDHVKELGLLLENNVTKKA